MVEQPKPALVEQRDREAAAAVVADDYGWEATDKIPTRIRAGTSWQIYAEAFAAHRIAAETAFAEREAKKDAEIAECYARIQSDAVELARCREALREIRELTVRRLIPITIFINDIAVSALTAGEGKP